MQEIDISQLYSMYSKRLHYIAYSILKDSHLAEDVVQETFVKAFRKIDSIDHQQKIGAWLSAISARTAIDFLRAEKRKNCLPADQSIIEAVLFDSNRQHVTENEVEQRFFEKELNNSMDGLKKEYREVLVLQLHYGLKEKEIAHRLHLRSTTIKNRLYRAKKQLKEALIQQYTA